jgi:LmbE family N-acetylglucosaminyl deacetylase
VGFRLAAVYAHPDDETYSNAGVVALGGSHLQYTLIVATSGETGNIADPSLATPDTLAGVREQEQRDALAEMGVADDDLHFLRYPDGGLAGVPRHELVDRIAAILREARPHVVVTFGPEGVTGHPDHVAIHQAATEAFHVLQSEATDAAFRRLFYCALSRSGVDRFWKEVRATGIDLGNPEDPYMPRGVPDHTITAIVDCRAVFERKMRALRAHRTQVADLDLIPPEFRDVELSRECFVQAWPPVTEPRGPVLGGLFEGLEP